MADIIIYGAGERCKKILNEICGSDLNVVAIVDAYKHGYEIAGKAILKPDVIPVFGKARICIAIDNRITRSEVRNELIEKYSLTSGAFISYQELVFLVCISDHHIKEMILDRQSFGSSNSVLFGCVDGLGLGGVEARVKALCLELEKRGRDGFYILTRDDVTPIDVDELLEDRIIVSSINRDYLMNSVKTILSDIINQLPCIVVTNQPDEMMCASYIIKYFRGDMIKVISIVSGSADYIYDNYLDYSMRSDLYIGVSEDIKNRLIEYGIPSSQCLSMSVPFPCKKQLYRNYSTDESQPLRIGYAGRLDGMEQFQKRMDLVLKLVRYLSDNSVDFVFRIAGDGPARESMENYLEQYGLFEKVTFLGTLKKSEMIDFWLEQDIGINLSDYEGRSISTAEMMGGGAVPVVTDTSGVRQDIVDGENGFIVPVGDYKYAGKKIEFLDKNREYLVLMGTRAHHDIYPKSRMKPHADFWEKLLWSDFV